MVLGIRNKLSNAFVSMESMGVTFHAGVSGQDDTIYLSSSSSSSSDSNSEKEDKKTPPIKMSQKRSSIQKIQVFTFYFFYSFISKKRKSFWNK